MSSWPLKACANMCVNACPDEAMHGCAIAELERTNAAHMLACCTVLTPDAS